MDLKRIIIKFVKQNLPLPVESKYRGSTVKLQVSGTNKSFEGSDIWQQRGKEQLSRTIRASV